MNQLEKATNQGTSQSKKQPIKKPISNWTNPPWLEIEKSKSCVPVVKLSLTQIKTSHPLPRWIELGRACI